MKYVYLYDRLPGHHDERRSYALTYLKKQAIHWRKLHGGSIYRLSYGYFKDCGFCMDLPTFVAVAEKIA